METLEEVVTLRELGGRLFQGYFFTEPAVEHLPGIATAAHGGSSPEGLNYVKTGRLMTEFTSLSRLSLLVMRNVEILHKITNGREYPTK